MPDRRRMLELALKGLKAERATIDNEITEVQKELNAPRVTTTKPAAIKQGAGKSQNRGSHLTAAGRKKLSDLMKKRWAEKRKGKVK